MAAKTICISHTTGAGGEAIGREVSKRLGYRYLDEEIVTAAADKEELDPTVLEDAEKRPGFVERILEALEPGAGFDAMPWTGAFPDIAYYPTEGGRSAPPVGKELYRALIRESIVEAADRGNAVIVAHAASLALPDRRDVLRVFVTASEDVRVARLASAAELDDDEARDMIRESDRGRAAYLERFYEVEEESPLHYDVVVNTDHIGAERSVAMILAAAG